MIAESTLKLGAVVGSGGFADTLLVTEQVGGGLPAELVYKRWRSGATPQETTHVQRLVEFRSRLDATDRAFLDGIAAWPVELVGTAGRASGFLMPRAPGAFLYQDHARGLTTAAVGMLYAKAQRGRRAGASVPSDGDLVRRLTIVAQLAYALAWLHARGCVFGDISHANELFTIKGRPRVYLIDTDGISIPTSRVPQADTPNYIPPESAATGGATRQTDVYKFTLVMVRVLSQPRQQLTQTASPDFLVGVLDAAGIDLVARGLSPLPQDRPAMAEFYQYLYQFVGAQLSPPEIVSLSLAPEFATCGDRVRVSIRVNGALGITVRSPEGEVLAQGAAGPHAVVTFPAEGGGSVSVEATNDHGTATASRVLHVLPRVRPPADVHLASDRPGWISTPAHSHPDFLTGSRPDAPPALGVAGIRAQRDWRPDSRRNAPAPRHYPVGTPTRRHP